MYATNDIVSFLPSTKDKRNLENAKDINLDGVFRTPANI